MKYPIAETFLSIQGEGVYTGQVQFFIRLAGCSVGKRLPIGVHEECTAFNGKKFVCDTDFSTKELLTVEEISARIPKNVMHVSITGGEPFMRDLSELCVELIKRNKTIHFETSGTIDPPWFKHFLRPNFWVICSPKENWLPEVVESADELKLLVDEDFPDELPPEFMYHPRVFLQPINGLVTIDDQNLQHCITLLQTKYPNWRLSTQAHKYWSAR